MKYLKEWVPSYLHNYAMPVEEPYFDERMGSYQFTFPRIVNGIVVVGDEISVGIAADSIFKQPECPIIKKRKTGPQVKT